MTQLRLVQVDAFADRPFTGNPAAVVPLDQWLPDETMQAIAMENNLSETAFTVPTDGDADYELRWFTPTTEVALCGHATLASGHVLIAGDEVRFRTRKAGVLTVGRDGDALTLSLPQILVKPDRHETLLDVLGTPEGEFFLSYEGVEATSIVLLPDAEAVRACAPDMKALGRIDLMVIVTAPDDGPHDVVSRVFVPAWGVDEDPVTGSAHAALTPFWCDRLGRESFTAYQASRRGGLVQCRREGDRVVLGGQCVTVMEGTLRL
ncbi:PhzF family phenazine biosynthesis protein [Sphingosinicella humi]|uniref:PhzF family phenazine biosynthesis protein n=1 Tax=Allosphingosinicella humi TaxID=2068657 RepID=A0A2U2J459_9SPHN|nr:PhzF family phenazine biosynthesis protein [Sphingosinicella humi]PWG03102.1 PhzF family phenazine biosynthesis protein [Sphingosinicella humi]